jgi:hypothetical protein
MDVYAAIFVERQAFFLFEPSLSTSSSSRRILKDDTTSSHHITNGTAQPASVMVRYYGCGWPAIPQKSAEISSRNKLSPSRTSTSTSTRFP